MWVWFVEWYVLQSLNTKIQISKPPIAYHQKDMRLKRIGIHADNLLIILSAIVNTSEGKIHDRFIRTQSSLWKCMRYAHELQSTFDYGFADQLVVSMYVIA